MLAVVAWLLTLCCSAFAAAADEVEIDGLAATFLVPEATAAAAVIIAGSGPTDRNGNSHLGLKTDAYKLLAEALLGRGIATVRCDKRGVGGSGKSARPEPEVVFGHYVDDAISVARWLQARTGNKSVFLIGHSEGGTLALLAAKQLPAAGVVLLTAPGRTLATILREQYSKPGTLRDLAPEAMNIVAALERGEAVIEVDPRLAGAFRPSVQPYLRSSISLDPAALVRGVRGPLLIVGGGRDFQVGKSDFDALSAARPDAAAYWDPDMAHTLKMSRADPQSVQRAYTDPSQPLAPSLSDRVAEFILTVK
jgi:pimeloyl-ACP methyl ester carboxylesterase